MKSATEISSAPVVGIVRLPHAGDLALPSYETAGAAGMDLRAAVPADRPLLILPGRRALVPTGLVFEIPEGFEGQIRPRSGLAFKHGITCLNTPGTIDSDYRGEVKVLLINHGDEDFVCRARHAHRPDGDRGRDARNHRGARPRRRDRTRCQRLRLDGHGMSRPKLVIFDCDGVLVDTEPLANRRLSAWLSEAGFPVSYEECRRQFVGRSLTSVQKEVEATGVSLGSDFVERWYRELPSLFGGGVEAIPHIETFIGAVKAAGIAYCVASSARVDKMHMTLGQTGLLPHFRDVLFSATMVERGKPFPDLFLHAAARWALLPPTASSSRTASPAREPVRPPACGCLPIMATRTPTATGWRRRAGSCSTTCGVSPD